MAHKTASSKPGTILGMGASCFVSTADVSAVFKGYEIWVDKKRQSYYPRSCEDALIREDLIYKHLGKHPQVLKCFGLEEVHPGIHSLRLELAPLGNVRQFIEEHEDDRLPERSRLQMALDVAVGVSFIHSRGVRHTDLSCRNLFLFEGNRVKLGDFGASMLDGREFDETVYEESGYELPCRGREFGDRPVFKKELFALGSAIYEIMAWTRPFKALEDSEIEARYSREEFPSLDGITVGQIISGCWKELYGSADEVVMALRRYFH